MKFLQLSLEAFGPFTDFTLDLSNGTEGFYLIHGMNEAGKSTTLRALRAVLFGIETRTTDDFLHKKPDLRIGAGLRHSDGTELTFTRRKGQVKTLRGATGKVLSDAALEPFLAGVTPQLFSALFSMDHEELRQGGQQLIEGKGDIGKSLFAAGMGTSHLRELLDRLDEEAKKLFTPRGKLINQHLKEYKELCRLMRGEALSGKDWKEQEEAFERAEREYHEAKRRERESTSALTRLERLAQVLPRLAERKRIMEERSALGTAPPLREDFQQDRLDTQRRITESERTRDNAERELAELEKEIDRLTVPEELLGREDAITGLYAKKGAYRDAVRALPLRRQELEGFQAKAERILTEIRPGTPLDQARSLELSAQKRARLRELGNEHRELAPKLGQTERDVADAWHDCRMAEERLAALPPPCQADELAAIVDRIRKQGDLEAELLRLDGELERREEQITIDLAALGLWAGSPGDLEALAVPARETVDRYEEGLRRASERIEHVRRSIEKTTPAIREQEQKILAMEAGGSIPAEEDLTGARAHRETGWHLVREKLDGREDEAALEQYEAEAADLPTAYEKAVRRADDIADRLRVDSRRVADLATCRGQIDRHKAELETLREEEKTALATQGEFEASWKALWAALAIHDALPPREMSQWLSRREGLVARIGDVRHRHSEREALAERIEHGKAALAGALAASGENSAAAQDTLAALADGAERLVAAIRDTERTRETLTEEVRKAKRRAADGETNRAGKQAAMERWLKAWSEAVRDMGTAPEATPAEVDAIVERTRDLIENLNAADRLAGEIRELQNTVGGVTDDARTLTEALAPELVTAFPDAASDALHRRLTKAKENAATLAQLGKRREKARAARENALTAMKSEQEHLAALCAEAGGEQPNELPALEEQSKEKRRLRQRQEGVEETLLERGGGRSIEELGEEAAGLNADELAGQIEGLKHEVAEAAKARENVVAQRALAGEKLKAWAEGASSAADRAEEVQDKAARIGHLSRRYVTIFTAAWILRREIERYREAHQGPLIQRAGEVLRQLTHGRFRTLEADYDDKGNPVIYGVRESGSRIDVTGMSEGSRDQLYLALRLACLEANLETDEPMPFVVDDVLVNFDDDRSKAALDVFADLSRTTQVIFFTHHSHLANLARETVPADVLQVRELPTVRNERVPTV